MSRAMLGGLATAALVAAFALGTRFGGVERVEVARASVTERAAPAVVTVSAPASGEALTADQVRAIVREELAHARAPSGPDPEVVEAPVSADRAHEVVARAIDRGTWSEQDRDELRAALQHLERAQIDDVLVELFPAVNDGRVTLTYDGTPI